MADNLYWVSTLVYAITLILFLWNDIKSKRKAVGPEKDCRMMFLWVIIFCLQDMIWGLCQNHIIKGDTLFFLSSTVFHLSTVITTFFWLKYILSFLNDKIKNKLFYLIFDGVVVIFEFIFVIINFFKPVLFSIRDGVYYTETFRTVTFINQYIVYIVIGLSALFWSLKEEKKSRQKYRAVFCFSLAPIIAGGFQLLYPDAPFYSTGYFLGCIIVHIFITANGRELLAKSEVIKSIADIYFSMHIIDMENKKIEPYVEPEEVLKVIGKEKDLQKRLNNAIGVISTSPYESSLLNFIDLDSISERMTDNNSISFEFVAKKYGWIRISFISLLKENDTQKRVMLASQIINKEKNEQEELIYKSNNDEMTRVFNRRAYQKDMDELIDNKLAEDLLYVAMDVNGLKNVNDSYGHVAGDELLVGASYCMQKCFGEYGNLYRIGGDEFVGILHISKDEFITVKKYFDNTINEWSGERIDEINLSCGYVFAIDHPEMNIVEIAKLADDEMYNEKAMFYAKK